MTVYAYVGDVEASWRPLSGEETGAAAVLLERVSALIRANVPNVDTRIAADPDLAVIARGIAVDAVLRVLRNPSGMAQETVGPFSFRRSEAVSDGALYLTAAELAQLNRGAASARGAFTIRPGALPCGTTW